MASAFSRMSKWLLVVGGAMLVAGLIFGLASLSGNPAGVSAQASPFRGKQPRKGTPCDSGSEGWGFESLRAYQREEAPTDGR